MKTSSGLTRAGHFRAAGLLAALCWANIDIAVAAEVALVSLLGNKALISVDGGKRQMLAIGASSREGVKLLAVDAGIAVVEVAGQTRRLRVGEGVAVAPGTGRQTTTLIADARGHFITPGSINGSSVRFLVDTGATFVSLGAGDARRARIDTTHGRPGLTMTANGPTRVRHVKLDQVKLGDITINGVDAAVHEHDMPVVLLGMSFLNRMEMRRDGPSLVLVRRY